MSSSFISLDSIYEITGELGAGTTATVYQVRHRQTGRFYAAKCYNCENGCAFHEIAILRTIHHPVAPQMIAYGLLQGKLTLIQELVQGIPLQKVLEEITIPVSQAKGWMRQSCFFIDYLHHLEKPIFYCDLKPDNILVLPNGNLKVIDYGAAVFAGEALPRQGTPKFAPPELWNPKVPVGRYTDIYTLGSFLQYLLEYAAGRERRKSRHLKRIIKRCCRLNIKRRIGSVREILLALEKG